MHGAGSLRTAGSLVRAVGPTVLFLAAQAGVNRALTGEWSAAGAVRKLATSNPYATPIETALEVVKNLAVLRSQAFETPLGGGRAALIVPLLGLAAALDRRRRRLAAPAPPRRRRLRPARRPQHHRPLPELPLRRPRPDHAPRRGRARRRLDRPPRAPGPPPRRPALAAACLAPARAFPRQIDHFARSSANIAGQQVEVAARLAAARPAPRRILVGDAGAIPYLSGLPAIDGLGLGGYRGLPFARASVHGVPAVVELIERLPPDERPDVLALYPSWWPGLADVFGRRVDAVRIEDNVICGADEKVVYAADWSALAPPGEAREGALDALDVGDLVDERAHAYEGPMPRGGWVVGRVLPLADGAMRFDAGASCPRGGASRSRSARRAAGPAALVLRTDGGGEGSVRVTVERSGAIVADRLAVLPERSDDRWHEVRVPLGAVRGGDRVAIYAARGALRDFHVWLWCPRIALRSRIFGWVGGAVVSPWLARRMPAGGRGA